MLESSSAPLPSFPPSSTLVHLLFDCPTPPLTPSPSPLIIDNNNSHETFPPQQPITDNTLPQAMMTLAQAMTALLAQLQATLVAQPHASQAHAFAPVQAPHSHIKTQDLDPYNGSDPSNLCAFLSQCYGEHAPYV